MHPVVPRWRLIRYPGEIPSAFAECCVTGLASSLLRIYIYPLPMIPKAAWHLPQAAKSRLAQCYLLPIQLNLHHL